MTSLHLLGVSPAVLLATSIGCGIPARPDASGSALPAATLSPSPAVASLRSLAGFWASEGYGYQFEVTASGELLRSQVTALSCIPTWRAKAVESGLASTTYERADSRSKYRIRSAGSPDRIRIHPDSSSSDIVAYRLPGRLAVCEHPTADTPTSSFEVFAATFAENYGFFDLARMDWAKTVAAQRVKVTDQTSPAELFAILSGMMAPLQDAHTTLYAPKLDGDGRGYAGFRFLPGNVDPEEWEHVRQSVGRYLASPLTKACEGQLVWGMLTDDVGYLRIASFSDYHPEGFESGLAALEAALDAIFADSRRFRGLVVDVRLNAGGYDPYALTVAARLTGGEYVAFTKQARLPGDPSGWTVEQPIVVKPSGRPGYRGPLIVLTGPDTISAGETFVQALLERVPSTTRVGQRTQGVFSDVMERLLPNGWKVGVPNERYLTRGRNYDVTGIPPTLEVPVYAEADIAAGRDAPIEAALRMMRGAGPVR